MSENPDDRSPAAEPDLEVLQVLEDDEDVPPRPEEDVADAGRA